MFPSTTDLDVTTSARTQYQEAATHLTQRKAAEILQLIHELRAINRARLKCQDPQLKKELVFKIVQREIWLDAKLSALGIK